MPHTIRRLHWKVYFLEKRDLKRLSRAQLLELLIALARENQSLRQQLDDAKQQLSRREIMTEEAGSIAQASLQLNSVFEAAQSAADQYIENLRRIESEQSELTERLKTRERQLEEEIERQALQAASAPAEEAPPPPSKRKRSLFGGFKKE